MVKSAEMVQRVSRALNKVGSQKLLAEKVGVSQQAVSNWLSSSSASSPSAESLIQLGLIVGAPDCFWFWDQVGIDDEAAIRMAQIITHRQASELFKKYGADPEPVTEPLGNEPVGGEPTALKGLSKSVEEFWARNPGSQPVEPVAGEGKPATPAKKARRERRRKK